MSVLVVAQSHLTALGLASLVGQAGIPASVVSPADAEQATGAAAAVLCFCERWDEPAERWVRRLCGAPVIVISPSADVEARRGALRAGALDLVSADHLEEIVLKAANLSRVSLRPAVVIPLGPGRFVDALQRRIVSNGRSRDLPNTEMRLFLALYDESRAHPGHPVKPEALVRWLWGSEEARSKTTLRSHIDNLRDKIEENPQAPSILLGMRNRGYWLRLPPPS